jgi:uncharacterized protein (TIGR01655 family)
MEDIKMKTKIMIGITAVVIVLIGLVCFCAWFLSGTGNTYYYTQIDNNKIEQGDSNGGVINFHGGMSYSYTLPAYNENGDKKDITFGTSRELKEGAFIRLTVKPVRGVLEWSEVQYDELPVAVQRNYTDPGKE